ncbi:ABC transporter permease [Rathayibacter sp. KR2-224]|uniref:ABC transporter permease n=1 Tax=Rathayibacter sp. KR2-224 TaxID=3400913 RepID=UPI003BFFB175
MTTATDTLRPRDSAPASLDGIRLSFIGLLRSEWIKLRSLRSTVWCLALVILLSVGFSALIAGVRTLQHASAISAADAAPTLVSATTIGVNFTQLVAAVLGVLVISGEYGTGMIRSTFTAAPGRLGAYFAKLIVLAVVVFVVGVVSLGISGIVATVLFNARGLNADLASWDVILPIIGGAAYLALVAMLAFTFGAIIRSSAGGIAAALGTLLVLPVALRIVAGLTSAQWVSNVASFLPSEAGGQIYAYTPAHPAPVPSGAVALDALQGGLVLVAWVVIGLVVGAVLVKRRDV